MTPRQALALAVMAVNDVAERAPDVADWRAAGAALRAMLSEHQPPVGRYCEAYVPPGARRGRKTVGDT